MPRGVLPTLIFAFSAILFFSLGNLIAARGATNTESDQLAQIAALRAEVGALKRQRLELGTTGRIEPTAGRAMDDASRAALVADIKNQLKTEMGLLPVSLLRERRQSFVELYSYDMTGASNYGTAGYLGNGYFVTVKHGVVALGDQPPSRKIASVKIMYNGRPLVAKIVDMGDAQVEVDPGDWAILKVKEEIDLPALELNLGYGFDFAESIFRLGNDYSKGIILSTGYVGQKTSNNLITCLTDGHPGVSGGGVLNADGQLVGIPIGRMQGDYRFSFILPLRGEMFRKVQFLNEVAALKP
jgi:S1-C subfamily serine protease